MKYAPIQQQSVPMDAANMADFERLAQAALDPAVWAYISSGAGDEHTLNANAHAWRDIPLIPRVLRELQGGNTHINMLGRQWQHPLFISPMAHQQWAHIDGERAMSLAAAAQGAGYVLSMQSSFAMEEVLPSVVHEPGRGGLWLQMYWLPDRAQFRSYVERAVRVGAEAIVLTIDAPVYTRRDRERRAGPLPPAALSIPMNRHLTPHQSTVFDGWMAQAPTWSDVEWFKRWCPVPVILKGISHQEDARLSMTAGADAIIVSNHGGRMLDTIPATASLLPSIVDAVQGKIPVMVDGGIRRGTDILKAMQLGAAAVGIGRPMLYALATAGAMGVAHAIKLLRGELEIAMALTGVKFLHSMNSTS